MFKSRLSLIVRVNVRSWLGLLLLTLADVSTTCAVVIFRVKVSCITLVEGIILWLYFCLMFPRKYKNLIEAGEGDKREKNINAIRNKKQTNKQKYSIM